MTSRNTPLSFEGRTGDWTEEEKIHLALQIFQQRNERSGSRMLASQVLFDQLESYQVDWENLPLPTGRTTTQCRSVYNFYSRQSSGPSTTQSAGPSPGSFAYPTAGGATGAVTSRKRSLPSESLTSQTGRLIAPKQPSTYPTEPGNRPSITGHYPASPHVDQPPTYFIEGRKRRGRPTKKEQEERRRLVEERAQQRLQSQTPVTYGTPYAPQSQLPQTYQPAGNLLPQSTVGGETQLIAATGATSIPATQTPQKPSQETEPTSSGSSGSKRRKPRPPRLSTSDIEQPPPPTFGSGASGQASTAYSSPPQTGLHERQASAGVTSGPQQYEQQEDLQRTNAPEDNRTQNPRSRPWEETRP